MAGSLSEDEAVSREEAEQFVAQAFERVDAKIFDEAFFQAERERAKAAVLDAVARNPEQKRIELARLVDSEFRKAGMSHLRVVPPSALRKLGERLAPQAKDVERVSARMVGDIGIVRIPSFLVPEISLKDVQAAFRSVSGARAMLIDLRDNGGGSISSVIYVAQYLLGPKRTVGIGRTRAGMSRQEPLVFAGFFPDEQNVASRADVALKRREGYVVWRTPDTVAEVVSVPTFLLIDNGCGSACEAFSAAIREHHAAVLMGERTLGGLLGSVLFKSAWPGYALLVPVSAEYSPSGALVEGVGVPVDVEIEACKLADVSEADQVRRAPECIEEALRLVRSRLQPEAAANP